MLWTQLGELDMKHFELLQLQRQNNGKGMDMDGHGWTMEHVTGADRSSLCPCCSRLLRAISDTS